MKSRTSAVWDKTENREYESFKVYFYYLQYVQTLFCTKIQYKNCMMKYKHSTRGNNKYFIILL